MSNSFYESKAKIENLKNKISSMEKEEALNFTAQCWDQAEAYFVMYASEYILSYAVPQMLIAQAVYSGWKDMPLEDREALISNSLQKLQQVKDATYNLYGEDCEEIEISDYHQIEKTIQSINTYNDFEKLLTSVFVELNDSEAETLLLTLLSFAYVIFDGFDNEYSCNISNNIQNAYDSALNKFNATNDSPFAPSQTTNNLPQNNAHTSYPKIKARKWKPLKIYLILTTLFVALVFGLVFWSINSGAGSSSISIRDINGEMISVSENMEPITLPIFGTVGYDAIIEGIKNAAIIFIAWRIVLIVLIYIINYKHRKRIMSR